MNVSSHVVIIGGGPVGLAAAAQLVRRGMDFTLLEAGDRVGASMRAWGHVRLFSPWAMNLDPDAVALLERSEWAAPPAGDHPTGAQIVADYLEPLAALPEIARRLRFGAKVVAVSRDGHSRLDTGDRSSTPFIVRYVRNGVEQEVPATAVIDASGTWTTPNPLGAAGIPARGERQAADRITYGIPDVHGAARKRFTGRRVAVVGGGHSAANALLDLAALNAEVAGASTTWVLRRPHAARLVGGGANDKLAARGRLGTDVERLVEEHVIAIERGFRADSVEVTDVGVFLGDHDRRIGPFDEIVVATGLRPDLDLLRELRLDLDEIVEAPRALAPLIDPNIHSCGSVPPHGFMELSHPEPGFFMVGMKAYGRAPTFLLRTGYEQVRSVVAALAGDLDAASRVELTLPQSGACGLGAAQTKAESEPVPVPMPQPEAVPADVVGCCA
jgi:thioredoxin reductase